MGPLLGRLGKLRLTVGEDGFLGDADGELLRFSTGFATKPDKPPQIKGKVGLKPTFKRLSKKKSTKLTDKAAAGATLG